MNKKKDVMKFASLMGKLEAAFGESIDKPGMTLYFEYLNDMTIEMISGAVDYLIKNRDKRGFPLIAEIRAAVIGSTKQKAVEAWGKVLKKIGIDKDFDDPIIPYILDKRFGGISSFYSGDSRSDMADRKHFIDCYILEYNLRESHREIKALLEVKKE